MEVKCGCFIFEGMRETEGRSVRGRHIWGVLGRRRRGGGGCCWLPIVNRRGCAVANRNQPPKCSTAKHVSPTYKKRTRGKRERGKRAYN